MGRQIFALILAATISISALAAVEIINRSEKKLMIATTTSLYDTGLLDQIAENYKSKYGVSLYFIALGTGQSLEHARRGDADAVLVHSPKLENIFLTENSGGARKIIAYNFFSIVGPAEDPAGIENSTPLEALQKIFQAKATWVSRGDNSGTHTKEKSLWQSAGFELDNLDGESWYLESGSGMGSTLRISSERRAYTLADMGTYLKYNKDNMIDLDVLVGSGEELLNVYSVMTVNPENHPNLNFGGAVEFIEFLVSDEGQNLIGGFGVSDYGLPLFNPAVKLLQENSDPQIAGWIREYAFLEGSECPEQFRLGQDALYNE